MSWSLLIDWAVPSIIGFVFGYLTCLLVPIAVLAEDAPSDKANRRSQTARTVFGILLILLAIGTYVDGQRTYACFRTALEVRDGASRNELQAQIELLTTQTNGDRAAGQAAVDHYVAALRELQRVRAENPLDCR
jgi:hypothetical protein